MAWEPEDGRCRECNAPLECESEQLAGECCFCQDRHDEPDADEDDPLADFYNANGYL